MGLCNELLLEQGSHPTPSVLPKPKREWMQVNVITYARIRRSAANVQEKPGRKTAEYNRPDY
jgi:hypothetical protein